MYKVMGKCRTLLCYIQGSVSQYNSEPPINMIFQRVQNNSAQNAYLTTEIDRQEWELQRLRRETQTQRDQMMRLELERKKRTGFRGLWPPATDFGASPWREGEIESVEP